MCTHHVHMKPIITGSSLRWGTDSDGHGFAATGHTGTGEGDQIVTRDIPIPVLAGDGYVTRRNSCHITIHFTITRLPYWHDFEAIQG